jgi:ABC-2 type transport system permease protein
VAVAEAASTGEPAGRPVEAPEAAPVAGVRPVRIRYFVRLKLRMIGNGLRGNAARIVAFCLSLFFGVWLAGTGFLLFSVSGVTNRPDAGLVVAAIGGAAVVLGWLLLPLLFFGVDETLDPARFALLPLPRRTLALGMLAGACVGVPGVATAVAFTGAVVAGGARAGLAGAAVGLAGALLSLLLCVVLSRAVTSAFAGLLRSRRVRDLTAFLLALAGASVGPVQLLAQSFAVHPSLAPALSAARILGWTPFAAGFAAPYDLVHGQPLLALVRLAIVAVSVLGLLWWWSTTLESAMVGTEASGSAGRRSDRLRGGAVGALVPAPLRRVRPDPYLGILARELRYWSRDPRRRSGLISITVSGAVVPLALQLAGEGHASSLPFAAGLAGVLGAVLLANQFGFDGSAYAMHMLAAVRGRTELRARASALALVFVPLIVLIIVAVGLFTHAGRLVVPALGTVVAAFGSSIAVSSVLSILAAYPLPDSRNAFAVNAGSGSTKGLLALVGMVASVALALPVLLAAALLPRDLVALVLPAGLAWGVAAALLGTYIGGDMLERRGPELLVAVTENR